MARKSTSKGRRGRGGVHDPALGKSGKQANPTSGHTLALERAADLFKDFHGWEPGAVDRQEIPDTSVLVDLGLADGILYASDKFDGKKRKYIHKFTSRPRLCATVDGRALLLIGGRIRVKPEGITG